MVLGGDFAQYVVSIYLAPKTLRDLSVRQRRELKTYTRSLYTQFLICQIAKCSLKNIIFLIQTLGGHVVSRPNYSDLNPILAAGNATINVISKGKRGSSGYLFYNCRCALCSSSHKPKCV